MFTLKIKIYIVIIFLLVSCSGNATISTLAKNLVSHPDYLDKCKLLNPARSQDQLLYQGIQPGITKVLDLESLLGTPDDQYTMSGVTQWVYEDVSLSIEGSLVTQVITSVDAETQSTLNEIILEYGCPDIIFAMNTTEDQSGYTSTRLVYHNIGAEFNFGTYPSSLNDSPSSIKYFQPMNLDKYLEANEWTLMDTNLGKPIDWADAVK